LLFYNNNITILF